MKILVTGGAGYIGSVLVPALLTAGHHVHVLDNLRYSQELALAGCCADPQFAFSLGDVRDESILEPLVNWSEAVIPLAALVGAPLCDRNHDEAWSVNYSAIHLLTALVGYQWIIYPNTNSGYGARPGEVTEDTPMNPLSVYAESKLAGEAEILGSYTGISLRLATVFGMSSRMRMDLLVNDFVYRAVRDRYLALYEPHHMRNCVHVRDVARVFLHAIDNIEMMRVERMRGRVYNVALPEGNLTKLDLCRRIAARMPGFTYPEVRDGKDPDQRDCAVSSARLLDTGFTYEHGLDDGIDELVKGYSMMRATRYGNV